MMMIMMTTPMTTLQWLQPLLFHCLLMVILTDRSNAAVTMTTMTSPPSNSVS